MVVISGGVNSHTVLWGQTLIYTSYALAMISLVGWFAYRVTRPGGSAVRPAVFYSWVAFLVVIGGSLHLITYNTIPWVADDLHGGEASQTYAITVADHRFALPSAQLAVPCDELVRFSVTSADLTYGFGLFRSDHSMVTQMQVVPGHANDLLWRFDRNGTYSIRSTEYSGPEGYQMVVPDAVRVSGCATSE